MREAAAQSAFLFLRFAQRARGGNEVGTTSTRRKTLLAGLVSLDRLLGSVNDDRALDDLERFLLETRILATEGFSRHGAHRSYLVILAGGIGVLAKPADTVANGDVVVGREAAAWTIARELGWSDLLGATVRRTIRSPDSGQEVAASLQVLWPDYRPIADVNLFSDEDVWRAAVFDAVVAHEDRNNNNWVLVPDSGIRVALSRLADPRQAADLGNLLDQQALQGVQERAARLAGTGTLTL